MKPRIPLAVVRTPDGGEMTLIQHDHDFSITINGAELMLSRHHESELALARLGCAHLAGSPAPSVLIGGLGMGYTLRQALDLLPPQAQVRVAELLPTVVEWNQAFLGQLNGQPLADPRVSVTTGDIVPLLAAARGQFDAILLDVDNGPRAMTVAANSRLYGRQGLLACRRALRGKGCLAVWSAEPSREFEQLLLECQFQVRRYRVPAFKGSKSQSRFVWVATEDRDKLPPGGGEPRSPTRRAKAARKGGR